MHGSHLPAPSHFTPPMLQAAPFMAGVVPHVPVVQVASTHSLGGTGQSDGEQQCSIEQGLPPIPPMPAPPIAVPAELMPPIPLPAVVPPPPPPPWPHTRSTAGA